jgi:hypothetical protein
MNNTSCYDCIRCSRAKSNGLTVLAPDLITSNAYQPGWQLKSTKPVARKRACKPNLCSVDHQSFIALIRSEASKQKKAATPARRLTGPKPKIEPRIIADMDRDIAEGSLTREALEAMLEKELADRYQAKRERVRAARLKVLNGHG